MRLAKLVASTIPLMAVGCQSHKCSCPEARNQVYLAAEFPEKVASVTSSDPACSPIYLADSNAVSVMLVGSGEGVCKITASLVDGTSYDATVSYRALPGCCSSISTIVDSSSLLDAGSD